MGRPLPVALFSFESNKCACELSGMSSHDCCDDEHELVKIEDDHSFSQAVHTPAPDFNFISELFSEQTEVVTLDSSSESIENHNVPPPKVPIYQSVCSLVFYESVV